MNQFLNRQRAAWKNHSSDLSSDDQNEPGGGTMQVYFDSGIIQQVYEDQFLVYSPLNHIKLEVNPYAYYLIELILAAEGRVDVDQIIQQFEERFQVRPKPEEILEQVTRLLEAHFFFVTEEEMEQARQHVIQVNTIPDKVPSLAYLLVTYRCNFDCSYCYLRDTNKDLQELTTEEWVRALEILRARGIRKVAVTGGEPLVRHDIVKILQKCKDLGMHVTLLTNGSLLNAQFDIIQSLIDQVVISLDSFDRKVHATTRSEFGFEDILEVIGRFAHTAPHKIQVRAVITKHNIDEMGEYSRRINEEYGIQTIRTVVNPIRPEEVDELPDVVGKLPLDNDRINSLQYKMTYRKCGACSDVVALDPAGDIYPCQTLMTSEFKIANIFAHDWMETFWGSDVRKMFTQLCLDNTEVCQDCSSRYLCGGCCPAIAYNIYGALNRHVPFFCEHLKERAILSLAIGQPAPSREK